MFFDVTHAQYDSEYRILLEFEDESKGTVDLSDYIKPDTVFEVFRYKHYFKNFRIEYGTLVWGEGEVDIAPETLYERATEKKFGIPQGEMQFRKQYDTKGNRSKAGARFHYPYPVCYTLCRPNGADFAPESLYDEVRVRE